MQKQFNFFGIIAVSVLNFILISCGEQQKSPFEVTNQEKSEPMSLEKSSSGDFIYSSVPDCYVETYLLAGAGNNDLSKASLVGTVYAFAWGDYVYVKYHITRDNCYLTEVHVYVDDEKPSTGAPGQFDNQAYFSEPYPTSYLFQIPWRDKGWQCNTVLYVAAHATVCCGGEECETAWADGNYSFRDEGISKKWGWFFDFMICCYGD